jgi:inorganic triphosphatase YgiF
MKQTAKFSITDPSLFWTLQTIDQIGSYSLSTRKISEIEDNYLDTKKRRLYAAGYSCRKRDQDQGVLIRLSRLPSKQKPVKHWETWLERNIPYPVDWPESEARKRIIKVVSDKKLRTVISLNQTRIVRNIQLEDQKIGRFNLDEIMLMINGKEQHFKQLRVSFHSTYETTHLEKITNLLLEKWPLKVETRTKFERALALERKI